MTAPNPLRWTPADAATFQPYYRAYVVAHQGEAGDGADYIIWMHAQWRAWERTVGRAAQPGDDAAFGAWLDEQYPLAGFVGVAS